MPNTQPWRIDTQPWLTEACVTHNHDSLKYVKHTTMTHWNTPDTQPWLTEICQTHNHDSMKYAKHTTMTHWDIPNTQPSLTETCLTHNHDSLRYAKHTTMTSNHDWHPVKNLMTTNDTKLPKNNWQLATLAIKLTSSSILIKEKMISLCVREWASQKINKLTYYNKGNHDMN